MCSGLKESHSYQITLLFPPAPGPRHTLNVYVNGALTMHSVPLQRLQTVLVPLANTVASQVVLEAVTSTIDGMLTLSLVPELGHLSPSLSRVVLQDLHASPVT
mgnify:CR=1 FL=1